MEEGLGLLTQFGAAGLIGLMWVLERRQAAAREKQLDEAHRRIVRREEEAGALLSVVKENTRAIVSLEQGQRQLAELLRALLRKGTGA